MRTLLISIILASVSARIKTLVDTTGGTVDTEKTTVNPKAISLGSCPCDLSNSCDVYCCCDPDCSVAITDFWKANYADYCAKSYIFEKYKPEQQCIDDQILYNMNLRMGMSKTTTNQKTCVNMDVGGAFQTYVDEKKTDDVRAIGAELTPNYSFPLLKQLSFNEDRQSKLFSDNKYESYMKEGDQMMVITGNGWVSKQLQTFHLPQPIGFNGICMSSIGVQFMKDIPSESCHQYINDLSFASNTYLKPDMYGGTNFLGEGGSAKILNGIGKFTTGNQNINIGDVWILDSTNQLTKQASSFDVSAHPTYDSSACSITNAVKEAFYTVTYQNYADDNKKTGFRITGVTVDLVLLDTLTIDSAYCTELTGADQISSQGYNYEMKFGIKFVPKIANVIPGAVVKKSGNPGYKTSEPIIVGENADFTAVQSVNQNGFQVQHHDVDGNCFKAQTLAADTLIDHPIQILNFEELTYLTCSLDLSRDDLKSYCEGSSTDKFEEYEIFKQFYDRFKYVSAFGNSNIQYEKDWAKVIFPTGQESKPPAGTWDDTSGTCSGVAGMNIRFITSQVGFITNPQKYIVAAEVAYVTKDWQFTAEAGSTQSFQHVVSMQYHDIIHETFLDSTRSQSSFFLPKLPSDLFYPFELEY